MRVLKEHFSKNFASIGLIFFLNDCASVKGTMSYVVAIVVNDDKTDCRSHRDIQYSVQNQIHDMNGTYWDQSTDSNHRDTSCLSSVGWVSRLENHGMTMNEKQTDKKKPSNFSTRQHWFGVCRWAIMTVKHEPCVWKCKKIYTCVKKKMKDWFSFFFRAEKIHLEGDQTSV